MSAPKTRTSVWGKILAALFIGIFGIAAAYITYTHVTMLSHIERSRDWQSVPGTVVDQKLDVRAKPSEATIDLSEPMRSLTALYTYSVDGKTFEGKRVDFNPHSADNFSGARKIRQRDLLNAEPLIVYYDPAAPDQSVIDRSLPAESALFSVFFLLFPCGFAVLCLFTLALHPLGRRFQLTSLPLTGIFHGGMALWLLVFYHADYGIKGLTLLALISSLFFAGVYHLIRGYAPRS